MTGNKVLYRQKCKSMITGYINKTAKQIAYTARENCQKIDYTNQAHSDNQSMQEKIY